MAKRAALFLIILFHVCGLRSQTVSDSSRLADTATLPHLTTDTAIAQPVIRKLARKVQDSPVIHQTDTLRYSEKRPANFNHLAADQKGLLDSQPQFNFSGAPVHIRTELYERESYEGMFYWLVGMLFYFALVKLFFGKYLGNLMTLFFRASMRQQQLREQILQSPFPSLLLNVLFLLSGGLYGALILRFYHFIRPGGVWLTFFYIASGLALLYLLKFLILKLIGWIFNINRTVDTYLFVVFMTNKIIGIFLLPFLILISFAGTLVTEISITVSVIMIGIFYAYRLIGAYGTLHKEIKISGLHFLLYLCAFEIAPLLLIYKVLVNYLEKAY